MNSAWLYRMLFAVCLLARLADATPSVATDLGTKQDTLWSPYLQWTVTNPTWMDPYALTNHSRFYQVTAVR